MNYSTWEAHSQDIAHTMRHYAETCCRCTCASVPHFRLNNGPHRSMHGSGSAHLAQSLPFLHQRMSISNLRRSAQLRRDRPEDILYISLILDQCRELLLQVLTSGFPLVAVWWKSVPVHVQSEVAPSDTTIRESKEIYKQREQSKSKAELGGCSAA